MVNRDIYKDEVDFAVLALQLPAFNKQYASIPAPTRAKPLTNLKFEIQWTVGLQ